MRCALVSFGGGAMASGSGALGCAVGSVLKISPQKQKSPLASESCWRAGCLESD
jgi:hypothetical protein